MEAGLIDPEEERRRRQVMRAHGVYDAAWALRKVMERSDVTRGQNRLLITKAMAQDGPLPMVFPELEQLGDDGKNAQHELSVTILSADGGGVVAKAAVLRFLNSNTAYRIKGAGWKEFVVEGSFSRGDLLDLYTCRRGDGGERCLFFFRSKGGGDGAGAGCSPRSKRRKRSRKLQAAAIVTSSDPVADDRRSKDRKRAKNGHGKKEDTRLVMINPKNTHDGCRKAETTNEGEEAAWRLWCSATSLGKEAAAALLMLKWAT